LPPGRRSETASPPKPPRGRRRNVRRVERLHRRVRQVRELVLGDDAVSRPATRSMAFASPVATDGNPAVRASCLYSLEADALSARSTPVKSHSILRRSRACFAGQNLSATTATPLPPRERNLEHVAHALDCARILVVNALDARAEDGRVCDDRHLHSGQTQVEPELQRAVTLRAAVEPLDALADSLNSEGFLRRTLAGTGWRAASFESSAYLATGRPARRRRFAPCGNFRARPSSARPRPRRASRASSRPARGTA
jgi:hypothetical protein